ncbi:MAG TPA: hypothetical protein VL095_13575 [Flavisolibacter sp.]|nr:hypothetical protein [Flavisolibacter sp.]
MKRFLPALTGIAIVVSSCTKQPPLTVTPETPVTKKIDFEVYTQKDYSDAYYDNALAEVRLSIAKASFKDDKTTIVWDTTFNFRQFKQYPQMAQKYTIEKTVDHYENSETLQVSTVVMYNFNGYRSMEAKGDPVLTNEKYKLAIVSF